jgi:hypothetical protein
MDKTRGNRQRAENRAAVAVILYARVYHHGFQLIPSTIHTVVMRMTMTRL